MRQKESLGIIFNSQVSGVGMGGGDKIVLNIAVHLKKKYKVTFFACPEGKKMIKKELHSTFVVRKLNNIITSKKYFVFAYLKRIFDYSYITNNSFKKTNITWSSSDFLPDTVPGILSKLLLKKRWFANFFLRARNPFTNEVPLTSRTILYFVSQQISIVLFRFFADKVFVLSAQDKHYLHTRGIQSIVLSGGVNIRDIDSVKSKSKKYDACFVGRFHYQKGIPEEVKSVKDKINQYGISRNVILHGFLDGSKKYKIIKQSKVLLFPSSFESWGVVIAEAISCGTPVVAFLLNDIKDNFPAGVKWVENGNIEKYQKAVNKLISDDTNRELLSKKAFLIRKRYDWKNSANTFLSS